MVLQISKIHCLVLFACLFLLIVHHLGTYCTLFAWTILTCLYLSKRLHFQDMPLGELDRH
jgi:hypothetical protein